MFRETVVNTDWKPVWWDQDVVTGPPTDQSEHCVWFVSSDLNPMNPAWLRMKGWSHGSGVSQSVCLWTSSFVDKEELTWCLLQLWRTFLHSLLLLCFFTSEFSPTSSGCIRTECVGSGTQWNTPTLNLLVFQWGSEWKTSVFWTFKEQKTTLWTLSPFPFRWISVYLLTNQCWPFVFQLQQEMVGRGGVKQEVTLLLKEETL